MEDYDIGSKERRSDIVQKAGEAFSEKMSDLWWTFLVRGVFFLLLGLAALFWPSSSVSMLLRIFGFFLAVDAILNLVGVRRAEGQLIEVVPSLISIALGGILLFSPTASISLVFILLGLWAVATGVGHLIAWWTMSEVDPERDTSRNIGIIALAGGILLVFWPGTGSIALGWMLAVVAFVASIVMFYLASRFKRVNDRLTR